MHECRWLSWVSILYRDLASFSYILHCTAVGGCGDDHVALS